MPAKAERWCPRLDFLVPYQNVGKGANAIASLENTKLRTRSKVLEVRIQLPGGLIPSNIEVFCPQKSTGDAPDSVC